jgi:hypothetical protein
MVGDTSRLWKPLAPEQTTGAATWKRGVVRHQCGAHALTRAKVSPRKLITMNLQCLPHAKFISNHRLGLFEAPNTKPATPAAQGYIAPNNSARN